MNKETTMDLLIAIFQAGEQGYYWVPQRGVSTRFQHWLSQQDAKRCAMCRDYHGKIWGIDEAPDKIPPLHPNGHLPQKAGRFWREADIQYLSGKRGTHRIVWSNDGLIFVTYDHYATFYEIV